MPVLDPRLSDGFVSQEGGVNSDLAPVLLQPNQLAWLINMTVRGGLINTRPVWVKRDIDFTAFIDGGGTTKDFEEGYFQGGGTYNGDNGYSYLAASLSGRIFLININQGYQLAEQTISGDPSDPAQKKVYFLQAENWLIAQDTVNNPWLFNGNTPFRSNPDLSQIGVGGPMAYWMGRVWWASGNNYYGGDLVWSDAVKGRDSVIYATENTFLNEGGAFNAPGTGPITAMGGIANLDTTLGTGQLMIFTADHIYASNAPVDRTTWSNLQYPIQTVAMIDYGAVNADALVRVNGDLIFRSPDGIRSMKVARQDFVGRWANTPIGTEVSRVTDYDSQALLYAGSAVNFDNRMLMTVSPRHVQGSGVSHAGLVALDFNPISSMNQKTPPVWDGLWTGLNILKMLKIKVNGIERCFAFVLGPSNKVQLYELLTGGLFDYNGTANVPIQQVIETRGFSTQGGPWDLKRLRCGDLWFNQLAGNWTVTAKFANERSEQWRPWCAISDCAAAMDCTTTGCNTPLTVHQQGRSRYGLSDPPDDIDGANGGMCRDGYTFQVRLEMTGHFQVTRARFGWDAIADDTYGNLQHTTCSSAQNNSCQTGCTVEAYCGPSDFNYNIAS